MLRRRIRPLVICLAALAVVAGPGAVAAEEGLDAILADYRSIDLGPTSVAAEGQTLEIGSLTVTFRSGAIHLLRSAAGRPLGLYFEGAGVYDYVSEDPADRQVIGANLAAVSKAGIERDGTVHDTVESMLVFMAQPEFPHLWDHDVTPVESRPDDDGLRKRYASMWGRVLKTYLPYDHLAATARLNGGERQYLYAEIDGGKEYVGYSYDTVRTDEESLFLLRKLATYDRRFQQLVSRQPLAGRVAVAPAPLRLVHADLELSTDDNRFAIMRNDLTYDVIAEGVAVVPLDLANNVDPYQYDWESERDSLRVTEVTDGEGRSLEFSHRYHEILIQLPRRMASGESLKLHVESEGEVLTNITGERGDNYFEMLSVNWYPTPQGIVSRFTMELRCRTKKPFRPVSSGTLRSLEEDGDFWQLEAVSEVPIRPALLAGKYAMVEERFGDVTIRVYAYAGGRKKVLKNMPKLAGAIVQYYQDLVGPYPYDELSIVEVPEYGFGIAPSGIALMTTEAYTPRQDFLASYVSRGVNARLAHEIAHQWFPHKAYWAGERDRWLSESLAEYMAGMAMAAAGDQARVQGFDRMLDEWWRDALEVRDAGPITAASQRSGPEAARERFKLLYSRGPLVMRMLHSMVGNEDFFGILRRFLDNADMGYATTEDFARAATEVMELPMEWFVEDWIETGGIPEIAVEWDVRKAEDGGTVLAGTARVEDASDHKRLVIPLVLEHRGGEPQVLALDFDAPEKNFEFSIPAKPSRVRVDPGKSCLARFN